MTHFSLSRRSFLLTAAAAAASAQTPPAPANRVAEGSLRAARSYPDPSNDVTVDVVFTASDGRSRRAPAFWAGDQTWRWRFSAAEPGIYRYRTVSSETSEAGLHGVEGEVEILPYEGDNPLYGQGGLRVSSNRRYLERGDGEPFFWLGDTWWMGLTKRLRWPEDFQELAADRIAKGYNVVQIVAGIYPDMPSFDPRGANEGGFPWEEGYTRINPKWWDHADVRIRYLVEVGLTPCIVGCWGYYLPILGLEKIKRHWRYLVARWGAYPVVWCLAGEGSMPWYLAEDRDAARIEQEVGWTEMARYVRETDPFDRPITIHPSSSGREVVRDGSVLDFDMLQTGHSDYRSIPRTIQLTTAGYAREPHMPVIESEVCYEGILESCRQDIQRFMFWTTILNGCCGFTYGANGIWQVNRPGQPYGPSPHGRTWGDTSWREAMQLPGGRQVGLGAKLLRTLPWHRMEPHPEWVDPRWTEENYHRASAAGIPGELRVFYLPSEWNNYTLRGLERGIRYAARLFNPSTGAVNEAGNEAGVVEGDDQGNYVMRCCFPEQRDWVLILERS